MTKSDENSYYYLAYVCVCSMTCRLMMHTSQNVVYINTCHDSPSSPLPPMLPICVSPVAPSTLYLFTRAMTHTDVNTNSLVQKIIHQLGFHAIT